MKLYHYTCKDHGLPGIAAAGAIRPHKHPWLPEPLVWLTDLDTADIGRLGLTSNLVSCNRAAVQLAVETERATRWEQYARQVRVPKYIRKLLEEPPAAPEHWWVARRPIVVADPVARQLFGWGMGVAPV